MQKRKPTLQDVASKAGVSSATVSRCLNQPDKVRPEVREKIHEAISILAYVPDGAARALASKRTHTIGAIFPTIDNNIFSSAIHHLQTGLSKANYTLLLANTAYSMEEEFRGLQSLLTRGIDGIVLIGEQHHDDVYAAIERNRIPSVNLWTYNPASIHSCIGFDHILAGSKVAQHLLDLGHSNIGVVSGFLKNNDRATLRLDGVKNTLKAAGHELAEDKIVECRYTVEQGFLAARELLERHAEITAISCGNDILAIGAIHAARKKGLRIPEDISITGFDNIDILPFMEPALTTVNSPARRMGRIAAEYLIEQIQSGSNEIARIELQVELIVRETSGAAKNS